MRTRALTCITAAAALGVVLLAAIEWTSRATHDVSVVFYLAEGYRFSQAERDAIQETADASAQEARLYLPDLSEHLILRVQAGSDVIPETGETGYAFAPDVVYWTVDPRRDGGVMPIAETEWRPSLFHEFHHLVRGTTITGMSLMDRVIAEGMATVFERDVAGGRGALGTLPGERL